MEHLAYQQHFEPGGADRELLRYAGAEPLELAPGDRRVLVPVKREVQSSADGSLTEAVFPLLRTVSAVSSLAEIQSRSRVGACTGPDLQAEAVEQQSFGVFLFEHAKPMPTSRASWGR